MSIENISLNNEDIYSISYSATRVQNVASGYSLTITGKNLSGMTKVNCNGASGSSGVLGSSHAILMSKGKVETKTFTGESVVVVDPVVAALGKLIIFEHTPPGDKEGIPSTDSERVKYMRYRDYTHSFKKHLITGDIQAFIEDVFGALPIDITFIANDICKSLKNGKPPKFSSTLQAKSMEAIMGMKNPITVGEIFSQVISSFGLELYFKSGKEYTLEEPRMLQKNPKPIGTISRDDIIELSTRANPYNIPDMIVPSFDVSETFPLASARQLQQKLLSAQMSNLAKQKGTGGFKVETYQVPAIFTPTIGATRSLRRKRLEENNMPEISTETHSAIEAYFQAFAYKSSFLSLDTGSIRTVFRPDINVPYSWYKVDGSLYFISNIAHNVSRSSAETVLSIAGVYDPNFKVPAPVAVRYLDKEVKEEQDLIASLQEKNKEEKAGSTSGKVKETKKPIYAEKKKRTKYSSGHKELQGKEIHESSSKK